MLDDATLDRSPRRGFASDNTATIHTEVLEAISRVNVGHVYGYGHDAYTQSVEARIAEAFGASEARTFFVFNGSGANVLCLRGACRPWHAVICAETAHINTDEGGAPEAIAGVKILTTATPNGKLTPELIGAQIRNVGDEHSVQPRVVSVTQSTELGTVYTLDELRAIADFTHEHGMVLHLDGARLANAAAALGVGLREVTTAVGVDLVSFGGTKNGILLGEAVVVLEPSLAPGFEYLRKQTLQLASKMRFLSAQFDALLTDELWLRNASHANAMAARLAEAIASIEGVEISQPVQANAVFARLPRAACDAVLQQFDFYFWDTGEARWMCSWDTTPADVDAFADAIRSAVAGVTA